MSLFDWFADRRKGQFVGKVSQEPDEGDGLWSKCPECSLVVYVKDLKSNASVCAGCDYHHRIDSQERIEVIADPGSFQPLHDSLQALDALPGHLLRIARIDGLIQACCCAAQDGPSSYQYNSR